jgi:septal ring factor EnvC (AmiA/AmiB activator)
LVLVTFVSFMGMAGCTKRPNKQELTALDEACAAAKSAEQKLEDLKRERSALERELENKKEELKGLEEQRDAIKAKLQGGTPGSTN